MLMVLEHKDIPKALPWPDDASIDGCGARVCVRRATRSDVCAENAPWAF